MDPNSAATQGWKSCTSVDLDSNFEGADHLLDRLDPRISSMSGSDDDLPEWVKAKSPAASRPPPPPPDSDEDDVQELDAKSTIAPIPTEPPPSTKGEETTKSASKKRKTASGICNVW